MKFMFVVGGSYKKFYLNCLNSIKKIDLLIFNQDIIYEFDYEKEKDFNGIVSNELKSLNKKLKCPIVVYGILNKNRIRKKCFILCVRGNISVIDCDKDIYLYLKGKFVLISNKNNTDSKAFATIFINSEGLLLNKITQYYAKNYFICDKKSVSYYNSGKIHRKFRKYCYFSLSFCKKMI